MKKSALIAIIVAAVLIAGFWYISKTWHVSGVGGKTKETMGPYKIFSGNEPGIMVSFNYPDSWVAQTDKGKIEVYRSVRIIGPRNSDGTYSVYCSLRGSPLKRYGGKHENIIELIANYKNHLIKGSKIISEKQKTLAGIKATDVIVSMIKPAMHHKGIKAIPIPVKERKVFLQKDPYNYELTYGADEREYDKYAGVFEQLLKTFKFK